MPLLFGTEVIHGGCEGEVREVGRRMQDLWLSLRRGRGGLEGMGWRRYGEGKMLVIGGVRSVAESVDVEEVYGI